uniref:Uncharacterized protein n=1 Tax=Photinus pyralis TaxID=7054 RepID=A0A1Y1KTC4_PHOPY
MDLSIPLFPIVYGQIPPFLYQLISEASVINVDKQSVYRSSGVSFLLTRRVVAKSRRLGKAFTIKAFHSSHLPDIKSGSPITAIRTKGWVLTPALIGCPRLAIWFGFQICNSRIFNNCSCYEYCVNHDTDDEVTLI